MTAGPGDDMPAAAGHGRMRASRADRERVIDALKAAFVEERLAKDEFDVRVGQAYTSRTYAELAALTADLPGAPLARPPGGKPAEPVTPAGKPVTPARKAALVGAGVIFQPALLTIAILTGNDLLVFIVGITLVAYPIFLVIAGLGLIGSWLERSRGQSPPRPAALRAPAGP